MLKWKVNSFWWSFISYITVIIFIGFYRWIIYSNYNKFIDIQICNGFWLYQLVPYYSLCNIFDVPYQNCLLTNKFAHISTIFIWFDYKIYSLIYMPLNTGYWFAY